MTSNPPTDQTRATPDEAADVEPGKLQSIIDRAKASTHPDAWLDAVTDAYLYGLTERADREREAALWFRVELAEMTADRDRWRAAGERYSQQREDLRGELADAQRDLAEQTGRADTAEIALADVKARLAEVTADRDRLATWVRHWTDLADARMRERDQARAVLATARRDAAADALDAFAVHVRGSGLVPLAIVAERWAAEVRAGTRPAPGSHPQPASEEGGDDAA